MNCFCCFFFFFFCRIYYKNRNHMYFVLGLGQQLRFASDRIGPLRNEQIIRNSYGCSKHCGCHWEIIIVIIIIIVIVSRSFSDGRSMQLCYLTICFRRVVRKDVIVWRSLCGLEVCSTNQSPLFTLSRMNELSNRCIYTFNVQWSTTITTAIIIIMTKTLWASLNEEMMEGSPLVLFFLLLSTIISPSFR